MKVLLINGSPHEKGCTYTALQEVAASLEREGIETEIFHIGSGPMLDCTACWSCSKSKTNRCVFDDGPVNEILDKAETADGFVFGTPVYYAHPTGRMLSVLDRAFYADSDAFKHKPGAAVVSARRAGTTASFDVMNKYFTIASMPVVSSSYWSMVHGSTPDEVRQDTEGLQTMRNIGKNMAWLLKCIEAGKAAGVNVPALDSGNRTNFIR